MALTQDQITAQNFKDFYGQIRPYLNGSAHAGFTPVGTVISVMGKQAPLNYLVCDGTVYNIKDYPELAAYFAGQFEVSNFFGGDGVTTFAIPDLRGEFLRGTGTNSHANQGDGANPGVHQNGTIIPYAGSWDNYLRMAKTTPSNEDSKIDISKGIGINASEVTATAQKYAYTSRPTNTSVLYCIATHNMFINEGSNYSTDEQIVGTWINGDIIYEKSFILGIASLEKDAWVDTSADGSNIAAIIDGKFTRTSPNPTAVVPLVCNLQVSVNPETHKVRINPPIPLSLCTNGYITIQYTKLS